MIGDAGLALRFLREVALSHYSGGEDRDLFVALEMVGEDAAGEYLPDFVAAHFADLPEQTMTLLRLADESTGILKRGALGASVGQSRCRTARCAERGTSVPRVPGTNDGIARCDARWRWMRGSRG